VKILSALLGIGLAAAITGGSACKAPVPAEEIEGEPDVPPIVPKVPEVPPEAAENSAVSALLGGSTKTPPKAEEPEGLERFRSEYVTTADVTSDPTIAKHIDGLGAGPAGKETLAEIEAHKAKIVPALRKSLWHVVPNVRGNSATLLQQLDPDSSETTKALVDLMLHDADEDVRSVVARVFVSRRDRDAVPALIEVLRTDPYVHGRANAAWALRSIADPRAADALVLALGDKETWVRLRAVGAVKKMKIKAAIPKLKVLAGDSNQEIREEARSALAALGVK
jgi:hypothetical protein